MSPMTHHSKGVGRMTMFPECKETDTDVVKSPPPPMTSPSSSTVQWFSTLADHLRSPNQSFKSLVEVCGKLNAICVSPISGTSVDGRNLKDQLLQTKTLLNYIVQLEKQGWLNVFIDVSASVFYCSPTCSPVNRETKLFNKFDARSSVRQSLERIFRVRSFPELVLLKEYLRLGEYFDLDHVSAPKSQCATALPTPDNTDDEQYCEKDIDNDVDYVLIDSDESEDETLGEIDEESKEVTQKKKQPTPPHTSTAKRRLHQSDLMPTRRTRSHPGDIYLPQLFPFGEDQVIEDPWRLMRKIQKRSADKSEENKTVVNMEEKSMKKYKPKSTIKTIVATKEKKLDTTTGPPKRKLTTQLLPTKRQQTTQSSPQTKTKAQMISYIHTRVAALLPTYISVKEYEVVCQFSDESLYEKLRFRATLPDKALCVHVKVMIREWRRESGRV